MKKIIAFVIITMAVAFTAANAQQLRIAVLPFDNSDGNMDYNIWSYKLQDSLYKELSIGDPDELNYRVVPIDSVEMVLAELNLDPENPQYASDLWKAIEILGVDRVVTGNFKVKANRFLINAYVYYVATKMPHPKFQARNIFKKEEDILSAVPFIHKKLRMAVIGN
ncbi:MAG: hypothetical protein ACOC2K_04975 [Bacteroidota bacterium]